MSCLICGANYTKKIKWHLLNAHSDIFDENNVYEKYYFQYMHPDESIICSANKYTNCNNKRKQAIGRFRYYSTCGNPNCKYEMELQGLNTQWNNDGGLENWHDKVVKARKDHGDNYESFRNFLIEHNINKNDYYNKTGYKTEYEKIFR